jgi:formiminoglutamase
MSSVEVSSGESPLILAMPHSGTYVPPEIEACLNDNGRRLTDTDWHVDELYGGIVDSATTVKANFHRYVIDANRDPAGVSLYPGQNTTELVPTTDFGGNKIWAVAPNDEEKGLRVVFHANYHEALKAQIDRVREKHGYAILYDCHSIASVRPFLFDGLLPDFNIGDNDGRSCALEISEAVLKICASADGYTHVLNGRFKGGWTTRHYGDPDNNIHAIQMELSQAMYLAQETEPFKYDAERASRLRQVLTTILTALSEWMPNERG